MWESQEELVGMRHRAYAGVVRGQQEAHREGALSANPMGFNVSWKAVGNELQTLLEHGVLVNILFQENSSHFLDRMYSVCPGVPGQARQDLNWNRDDMRHLTSRDT